LVGFLHLHLVQVFQDLECGLFQGKPEMTKLLKKTEESG